MSATKLLSSNEIRERFSSIYTDIINSTAPAGIKEGIRELIDVIVDQEVLQQKIGGYVTTLYNQLEKSFYFTQNQTSLLSRATVLIPIGATLLYLGKESAPNTDQTNTNKYLRIASKIIGIGCLVLSMGILINHCRSSRDIINSIVNEVRIANLKLAD